MSLGKIAQGGFWLFISTVVSNLMGYFYVFTSSKFVSAEIMGSAAVVLSLQGLITGIVSFGIPRGLQRFLGECMGRNDHKQFAEYFMTSFIFALVVNVLSAFAIMSFGIIGIGLINLKPAEIMFVSILLLLAGWSTVLQTMFYSILQTSKISLATFISSAAKLLLGITLLFMGFDYVAVMLGYLSAYIVLDGLLLLYAIRYLEENKIKITRSMFSIKRPLLVETLRSGLSVWIPTALRSAGEKVGILGVYAAVNGTGAGLYFMAFSIAFMVISIPSNMLTLLLPVLSGMNDMRKRTVVKAIKINLAIAVPIALVLVIYPELFLSLVGAEYVEASDLLQILAISAIVVPVTSAYSSYILAVGKNVHMLIIGLTLSGSQLILSLLLIPWIGDVGAAVGYTSGYYLALIAILASARKIEYKFNWIEILKVIFIPLSLTIVLYVLHLTWTLGIPILLLGSFVSYTRLGIVTKMDSLELLRGFLSEKSISQASLRAKPLIKLMFRD